jgi:phospholipase D1/2
MLIAFCLLAAAWRWSPLSGLTERATILSFLSTLSASTFGPLFIVAVYAAGGFIMFPIVILIPMTAFIYGPLLGPVYALLGCLVSALLCYMLGKLLGSEAVYRFAGNRTAYLSSKLSQRGFLMIALFRFLPIAPYTLVNIVAGAFRMRLVDYTMGTLVGLLPGVVIMTLIENRLEKAVYQPNMWNVSVLSGVVSLLLISTIWFKRRFMKSALSE